MKDIPKISDAEWQVMKIIWEENPIASNEIVRKLKSETNWKDNTIYTLIARLSKKEMIVVNKETSPNLCYPIVSKEDCTREERVSFLKKVYNGSLNLMLANLVEDEELSEKEIEALKNILDRKKKKGWKK